MKEQHLWNEGSIPEPYLQPQEETINIHVITLRAYLSELATTKAFSEDITSFKNLSSRVDELLTTELCDAKEFVEVTDNFIRVGINRDLIDDRAVSQALEMVGRLDSLKPGTMIQTGQLVHVYENKISHQKRTN